MDEALSSHVMVSDIDQSATSSPGQCSMLPNRVPPECILALFQSAEAGVA